jgi:superfamily II DNA or RNA helicase
VFCASIEHARHVVAEFNSAGFRFSILVGEPAMSDAERTAVNKQLRSGELDGACTVDLVSEGYDLPDLECCIMLRPTASESLFIQQVGRVMRPSEGKTTCYLLDHVGNVGKLVDGEFMRKHGLPSEVRDWTLDGRVKKKGSKKKLEEKTIDVAQCPKCYIVHEPAPACPKCGHVYEIKARNLEQVEGELVKITPEMAAQIAKDKRREVGKAQSLEELQKIAAERGYKPSWARIMWETKNRRKAPQRPPEPSIDELKAMDLKTLERVASEQGWPPMWGSNFYYEQEEKLREEYDSATDPEVKNKLNNILVSRGTFVF